MKAVVYVLKTEIPQRITCHTAKHANIIRGHVAPRCSAKHGVQHTLVPLRIQCDVRKKEHRVTPESILSVKCVSCDSEVTKERRCDKHTEVIMSIASTQGQIGSNGSNRTSCIHIRGVAEPVRSRISCTVPFVCAIVYVGILIPRSIGSTHHAQNTRTVMAD